MINSVNLKKNKDCPDFSISFKNEPVCGHIGTYFHRIDLHIESGIDKMIIMNALDLETPRGALHRLVKSIRSKFPELANELVDQCSWIVDQCSWIGEGP